MIFSFVNYVFITDIISLEYVLQSVRDSNARPDEPVRTGKSFFLSGRPQQKIAVPARAGSDGNSPALGASPWVRPNKSTFWSI